MPFRVVGLHGLVRDQFGKKMSKSRGNNVDPLDWVDRFGADATRFTLARGANPGGDIAISEEWAAGSATSATSSGTRPGSPCSTARTSPDAAPDPAALSVPDRWILSRLPAVIAEVDELFEAFEFAKISDVLYHFAWDEVCDWYLELAKVPLASVTQAAAETTRQVLGYVLDPLLRLLHPVIPFVTEELWTALTGEESVVVAAWPAFALADADGRGGGLLGDAVVTEIRRFRSDQGLRPGQRVAARLGGIEATPLAGHEASIRALLRLDPPADGFAAVGVHRGRGHHRRARPVRGHRRRRRAGAGWPRTSRRPAEKEQAHAEAGQRRLHRQGARGRGRKSASGWRPPRPTSPASSSPRLD